MKILVADDSPILRAAVVRMLEPEGYEVIQASDGVEAVTAVFEQQPSLILLDLTMPRLNGYVVCRLIKEDPVLSATPVLILTGSESVEDRYWAERSGADGFLTKGSLGDGLVGSINSLLASQALMELSRVGGARPALHPSVLAEADVLTMVCEMLDRKLFEATVVAELSLLGSQVMRTNEVLESVFEHVTRLVAFDVAAIALVDNHRLYGYATAPVSHADAGELQAFAARHLASVVGVAELPLSELVWSGESQADDELLAEGWGSWYAAGLRAHGNVVGLLVLVARRAGAFPSQAARTLHTIEPPIAAVVSAAVDFELALARDAQENLSALSGY